MRLDRHIFRSRVARRVVLLFLISAMLPVAGFAVLAWQRAQSLVAEQHDVALAREATSYSTAMFERLVAADRQTRTIAAGLAEGLDPGSLIDARSDLRRLTGLATHAANGEQRVLFGRVDPLSPLDAAERQLLRRGESLLRVVGGNGDATRIAILRAVDPERADAPVVAAEYSSSFVFGESSELGAMTQVCVISAGRAQLYCSDTAAHPHVQRFIDAPPSSAQGRFDAGRGDDAQHGYWRELLIGPRFHAAPWLVVVLRPESLASGPLSELTMIVAPTALAALLLVGLLSLVLVRRTLGPLEALIAGTRRAAAHDFGQKVDVEAGDEFGELALSFNAMTARLARQIRALETMSELDRAILNRVQIDRIIELVLARIHDIVPAGQASLAIADRNAEGMARIFSRRLADDSAPRIERIICADADWRAFEPLRDGAWVPANDTALPCTRRVMELGAAEVFELAITAGPAIVGVMALGFRARGDLEDEQFARLRDLRDRIGVALTATAKDEQLFYQAHYDPLTDLPNRLYFRDQLARAIGHAGRDGDRLAVLFVDLDHFKRVNDSVGHARGDQLLREAAQRLRDCVRSTDLVARLGGDEFTILLTDVKRSRAPQAIADAIIRTLTRPFVLGGQEHFVNGSIGIAFYPADGTTADDLLRNADLAMYRAKEGGRGRWVCYEERMNAAAVARVQGERELRRAVEQGELILYYQPQFQLDDGALSGAEALVRWQHPEQGVLPPTDFIQLAEDTGLIEPIGDWVLREAVRQLAAWTREGLALPRMAINVSPRQFRQRSFPERIAGVLREFDVAPQRIELEITENVLLDATLDVEAMLASIKATGVRVALDDFGTGYSSLAYLKRFAVDTVKIDRSFVKDLPADTSSAEIARAIIAMAHALHKEVLAEGVSTAEQVAFLRRLQCEHAQGFHFAKPLSADEFRRRHWKATQAQTAVA